MKFLANQIFKIKHSSWHFTKSKQNFVPTLYMRERGERVPELSFDSLPNERQLDFVAMGKETVGSHIVWP